MADILAILLYVSLVVMIGAVRNKIEKGSMGQLACGVYIVPILACR